MSRRLVVLVDRAKSISSPSLLGYPGPNPNGVVSSTTGASMPFIPFLSFLKTLPERRSNVLVPWPRLLVFCGRGAWQAPHVSFIPLRLALQLSCWHFRTWLGLTRVSLKDPKAANF